MKIVADRYLPGVASAFGDTAEVMLCEPAEIENASLRDCDALLVRTVTRVDEQLLKGTPVRFVGTATSGCDHVDTDYLAAQGIGFADAAGSNARPVAEYVLSALAVLCEQTGTRLANHRVGIIGCGHVGSQLAALLETLGVTVLLNDPPLAEQGDTRDFCDLDTILGADIVTLHVPYTAAAPYPTANLIDSDRLQRLQAGTWLINTARGGVIDETALAAAIEAQDLQVVLDVWRHEPAIDSRLAAAVRLATPHIAGYSLDAKLRATNMVCQALCACFELGTIQQAHNHDVIEPLALPLTGADFEEQVRLAILNSYDIRGDAATMQRLLRLPAVEQATFFAGLRQDYLLRREFSSLELQLAGAALPLAARLAQLGFQVSEQRSSSAAKIP